MKKIIIGITALFLIMAALPALVCLPKAAFPLQLNTEEKAESRSNPDSSENGGKKSDGDFLLLCTDKSKAPLSKKDALSGALAAVLPQDCPDEAGYAVAAALYSRLVCLRDGRQTSKTGCELCEKGKEVPVYLSKKKACENFGEAFYSKCEKYAEYGIGTRLEYGGKTLDARIFSSCGGMTDGASELLGENLPCHESVPSPWDMTQDIKSSASYTIDEAEKIISKEFGISDFPPKTEDYIKVKSAAKSGAVLKAEVCGKEKTGIEIMNAFSLSSPNFKIKSDKNGIVFRVLGSGIPIGMSICGAIGMAEQGAECAEILSHYYTECSIVSEKNQ